MSGWVRYGAVAAALVGVLAVLALQVTDAAGDRAVGWSAAVAMVLQLVTFGVARRYARQNVMAAWAAGIVTRFAALVIYGFVGVRALGLRLDVALLSLALFLFATTLVEPLFLKP